MPKERKLYIDQVRDALEPGELFPKGVKIIEDLYDPSFPIVTDKEGNSIIWKNGEKLDYSLLYTVLSNALDRIPGNNIGSSLFEIRSELPPYNLPLELNKNRKCFGTIQNAGQGLELLAEWMGTNDNGLLSLRTWLAQAVASPYIGTAQSEWNTWPNDYCLQFYGEQGAGKSQFAFAVLKAWGLPNKYYISLHKIPSDNNKDLRMTQLFTLFIELGELDGITSKATAAEIKQGLSLEHLLLRIPYAKGLKYYALRCCYFGTSNQERYLIDETGNRRFLPIDVKRPVIHGKKSTFRTILFQEENQKIISDILYFLHKDFLAHVDIYGWNRAKDFWQLDAEGEERLATAAELHTSKKYLEQLEYALTPSKIGECALLVDYIRSGENGRRTASQIAGYICSKPDYFVWAQSDIRSGKLKSKLILPALKELATKGEVLKMYSEGRYFSLP
jgi:hypothetical protein